MRHTTFATVTGPWLIGCATGALLGCGGESLTTGLDQPIRIRGAQFHAGVLPGSRPLSASDLNAGKAPQAPYPTAPDTAGRVLVPGEGAFSISGRASTDTHAVAFQLYEPDEASADAESERPIGNGYWLRPVGSPDPLNQGELTWRASLSLDRGLSPGLKVLRLAAIDGRGRSGTQRGFQFCLKSELPDNLNACNPNVEPPALVVSVAWQNSADLDLRVVSDTGRIIDHDTTRADASDATLGQFEGDANRECRSTGVRRENIVWQTPPPAGRYFVYVNVFDACGERATPFVVSTHAAKRVGDSFRQVETFRIASTLTDLAANGNTAIGTYVTEFEAN